MEQITARFDRWSDYCINLYFNDEEVAVLFDDGKFWFWENGGHEEYVNRWRKPEFRGEARINLLINPINATSLLLRINDTTIAGFDPNGDFRFYGEFEENRPQPIYESRWKP